MANTRNFYIVFLLFGILVGCQTADEYRAERVKKVDEAFKKIKGNDLPTTKPLSLPYCIDLALKNNLDMKVYAIQQTVDNERKTAEMLGMLPDLEVSDGMNYRNNEPGAKSEGIATGQQSLEFSQSSQQYENRVKVELLLSTLDFGLAYFNSVQAQDKTLITGEEKRRAAQNLILDVTSAYLRVASAQYEMEKVEGMLKECESTEAALKNITTSRGISKSNALVEQKKFINLKLQLREYRRDYENSSIQLRSLMGYYPINEIKVDTTIIDKMANLKVPNIELLEEIALLERPELYQLDIQQHVTNVEARKKILMMFPNVQAFVDFTGDSNAYLYNKTWWEVGARAAYNLLKLPQRIQEYRALDAQADEIDAQGLALSVGILSQVRIAHASLYEEKERFELYQRKYEIYRDHVEAVSRQSAGSYNVSPFELTRVKMEAVGAAIERAQALGNYYLAYYRVLNSIGVENLNKETLNEIKKRMEANLAQIQETQSDDNAKIASNLESKKAELAPVQAQIDDLKKTIAAIESEMNIIQTGLASTDKLETNIEEAQKNLTLAQDQKTQFEASIEALEKNYKSADEKFESDIDNAPEAEKAALEEQRALVRQQYEKESAALQKQIEDSSYKVTDAEKALEVATATLEDLDSSNDKIASHKEELASYAEKLGKLDARKAEVDSQMAELEKSKAETETSLESYAKNIVKYENAINQMASDKSYESTMNLEMSQNVSGNLITPEEYTPSANDNIDIEAQKNADDNTLDSAEVSPSGTGNLTNQTLYNLDQNKVNVQEINAPQTQSDNQQFSNMPGDENFDIQQNMPAGRIQQ